MISRIKNIINLTEIFFQNSFNNPYLIDKKTNKFNKKSLKFWFTIIVVSVITYLSYMLIKELVLIDQTTLFLTFMFLVLFIALLFQTILIGTNIYYFSKDLELVLPLPINPVDLLIAKLNAIIINTYFFELIFFLLPLIIYGIYVSGGLLFYLYIVLLLLILPILPTLVVSIILMFFIKLSKFIKNKDIFQVIITFIFLIFIILIVFYLVKAIIVPTDGNIITDEVESINVLKDFNNKLKNINNKFLQINPSIELLNNSNKINSIINLFKILLIDFILFIFFIFVGKKTYLKNILKNNSFNTGKKIKKINLQKKCKKKSKTNSYINKEFKMLFKSPVFFIQCMFPIMMMTTSLIIILFFALPNIRILINSGYFGDNVLHINLNTICIIIAGIQILLTFSNTSITAISREGQNATFMKIIPIDIYKQILYKSMPQVIINLFFIFILCLLLFASIPNFNILYIFYIFIIANILSLFNSILMVAIDLKEPNLNWSAEHEVFTGNNKKLYQYVMTILIILFLVYCYKIFADLNIHVACILIILILLIILFVLNFIINKYKNKLLKKLE